METITQHNLEGVIIIKDKEGKIIGMVRNDLELRRPIHYRVEEMAFSDFEELYK